MGWSTHHPTGLIYYAPQHAYRGYTLTANSRGSTDSYLIDMEGRVCHRWHLDEGLGYGYLLDNGHLLARTNRANTAGADQAPRGARTAVGAIVELDWDSNLVWAYRNPMLHHDFQRLPNGNTLVLEFQEMPAELAAQVKGGIQPEDGSEPMLGDVVHELTPQGETVNSWRSWEHLNVEEDVICFLENRFEWTHQNSLNVTKDGDLLVSFRQTSTVGIVDRVSGEFTWKWGPGEISHQHNPTYLDNGHVLIFDNGPHHVGASFSRVVEVDPNNNEITWEYLGDPPISFYSYHISGAERLPNGNTLICEGAPGRAFEVTPNKEIVWEYIHPFHSAGNTGLGGDAATVGNSMFRVHRYGPDHPALQGRDLDPSRHANLNRIYAGGVRA